MKPLKPTIEALALASDLRDIADRLLIMARHLENPSAHESSADTLGGLAVRLFEHSTDWEIARMHSRTE